MKKFLILFFAVFAVVSLYAQADSNFITLVLPTNADVSTVAKATNFFNAIGIALFTIVGGFWAKGNAFLTKYLPKTPQRVALTSLLVGVGVSLAFGIKIDIWQTLTGFLSIFSGIGLYTTATAKAPEKEVITK